MRKFCVIILFIVNTLTLLTSCEEWEGRIVIFNDDRNKADARMEQLLKVITNKDEDKLKGMFSKQAINDALDFDDGMESLFDLIQGDIVSWKRERFSSSGLREEGKKYTKTLTWYTVVTDENDYLIFASDYIVNTVDPDNLGFYTLRAKKKVDQETSFDVYWNELEKPGIIKTEE